MVRSDSWFRTLIECAPEVYFRFAMTPARGFVYISPSITAALGYTPDDFYRDPALCVGLVPRDERKLLRQIVRARRSLAVVLTAASRAGTLVPLEVRTVPLIRRGGLVAVEGVARALTVGCPPDVGSGFSRTVTETNSEPVQQRLAALLFEVHELLHRTLPPSTPATAASAPVFQAGDVVLDSDRLAVTLGGAAVSLTSREVMVLRYFFQHAGRVITRRQLLTDVWGYRYTGDDRTVDVHVSRLRSKLPPLASRLVAVKHVGYRLDVEGDRPVAKRQIANI